MSSNSQPQPCVLLNQVLCWFESKMSFASTRTDFKVYELHVSPHILISAAYIYTHLHLSTPFVYPSTHCEAYFYPTISLIISNTLTRKHTFKTKGKVPVEYIVIIIINKHNVLTNGLTFFFS